LDFVGFRGYFGRSRSLAEKVRERMAGLTGPVGGVQPRFEAQDCGLDEKSGSAPMIDREKTDQNSCFRIRPTFKNGGEKL
jgi:hypothetical protein